MFGKCSRFRPHQCFFFTFSQTEKFRRSLGGVLAKIRCLKTFCEESPPQARKYSVNAFFIWFLLVFWQIYEKKNGKILIHEPIFFTYLTLKTKKKTKKKHWSAPRPTFPSSVPPPPNSIFFSKIMHRELHLTFLATYGIQKRNQLLVGWEITLLWTSFLERDLTRVNLSGSPIENAKSKKYWDPPPAQCFF